MRTETVGTNAKIISIDLPSQTIEELERRAQTLHLSADEYALCILVDCISKEQEPLLQRS